MNYRALWTLSLATLSAVAGVMAGCSGGSSSPRSTPTPTPIATVPPSPSRTVLVELAPGADRAAVERDFNVVLEEDYSGVWKVRVKGNGNVDDITARLSKDSRVKGAEKDQVLRSPEVHGSPIHQAFDVNINSRGVADSEFENQAAWNQVNLAAAQSITRGAGIKVAVLDTGVEAGHPDLSGKLLPGYNALAPGELPADAADGTLNNLVGHGTMVTGVIARIAPEAKILPVRVLNGDGVGSTAAVLQGMEWAIEQGADVINLSLGSKESSRFLKQAIDAAKERGVLVVAAAGNDGMPKVDFPAKESSVVCTTAVDPANRRSSFANYGPQVDLVAPGTGIRSAFGTNGYASWSGTSFAVPFVAGAAVLVRAGNPGMRPDSIIDRLEETAMSVDSHNPDTAGRLGQGLLDIGKAVKR